MRRRAAEEQRWWTLVAVCTATFMLLVDVTIVQVALPTIERHLHATFSDLEWVIDAYALSLASVLLTCGALADRFGRKRVFVAGVCLFTAASLACGLATGSAGLIGARAVQGLGGAAMFATGLALIGQDFHGAERGRAIAAWGATVGAAVAVGPLIGGALTDAFGWRWIFFVNIPVGIVTVAIAIRMVNIGDPAAKRLDVGGLVTFAGSLFLLILGLLRGNDQGWSSPLIVSLFAGSVLLMGLFVVVELRQSRPMFDLSLFRNPSFVGVSVATFAIGAGMFAMYPYLTLYLQNNLGYTPLGGGARLLPSTVLCFVVPLMTRSAVERFPPGVVLGAGLGITAVGVAVMTFMTATSTWVTLIPGLLLTGVGVGISNPAIARIGLGVVPPQRSGMASGISNTCRIGGLATGVAALGATFQGQVTSSLATHRGLNVGASQLAKTITSGGVPAARRYAPGTPDITAIAHDAFVSGMSEILTVGAATVMLGGIAGIALVRRHNLYAAAPVAAPEPT
ncbi:MAG TPA: MFS transporter [Gaiellales bacterium]|nr:MFS transporter [Gaiellales bacterium]